MRNLLYGIVLVAFVGTLGALLGCEQRPMPTENVCGKMSNVCYAFKDDKKAGKCYKAAMNGQEYNCQQLWFQCEDLCK